MPASDDSLGASLDPAKRAALLARVAKAKAKRQPQISLQSREHPLPLSYAQERIWLHERLHPGSLVYLRPAHLRLHGQLDVAALHEALRHLLARHEPLRTHIELIDRQPMQRIAPSVELPLPQHDLSMEDNKTQLTADLIAADCQRPFDLETDIPMRCALIKLSPTEHLLLLTFHHIAFDAWSEMNMSHELAVCYAAFQHGASPSLAALPCGYADIACWERDEVNMEPGRAFWADALATPPLERLPAPDRREGEQSEEAASVPVVLPAGLRTAVEQLARQHATSTFALLLSVFQVLLYRYSGQPDIIVGCPTANRTRVEAEEMIGMFINTLPLRAQLAGDDTFAALLARTAQSVVAALAHQSVPLQLIARDVLTERDGSSSPLFQSMFVHENFKETAADGLHIERIAVEPAATLVDLTLELTETTAAIGGRLTYRRGLWSEKAMTAMAGHFLNLLSAAVAEPTTPISRLNMLTPAEQNQLRKWNATAAAYPDTGLYELFAEQAASTPERTALIEGVSRISLSTLENHAARIADHLTAAGVQAGATVGLHIERSTDLVACMLGTLRCGAAFLPLDVSLPVDRVQMILEDAAGEGTLVCLTREQQALPIGVRHCRVLTLEHIAAHDAPPTTPVPARGDDPAYVIYTSGSTGQPKGVVGLHRGAVNRCHWMWRRYPFEADEVCCQKTSISFVDSIWETFGPLLQGVPLLIVPEEDVVDLDRFVDLLARQRVTRIVLVPSLLRVLLSHTPDLAQRLPHLRLWISSGEALPAGLLESFRGRLPHARLLNLYGSSEVSADVTCFDAADHAGEDRVPVGAPIANTAIHVLDANLQPLPAGVPGEVFVSGAGLAAGYLHQPDRTDEAFVTNPFVAGQRMYKTGDIGCWRFDGNLEWLGRVDHQIKLRGYRIETGEIEAALNRHPAVAQSAVVLAGDSPLQERLVGFCALRAGQTATVDDLRRHQAAVLPGYMVAQELILLDTLPMTTSGKLNRPALARLIDAAPSPQATTAPRNELERRFLAAWREVLARNELGVHDDFFQSGGHSLSAVALLDALNQSSPRPLSLAELYRHPTAAALAEVAEVAEAESSEHTAGRYVEVLKRADAPATLVMVGADFWTQSDFLSLDCSIVWLKLHGLHVAPGERLRLGEQAERHADELSEVLTTHKVVLCGYSYGGLLAYELATRLSNQNLDVSLVLLDPASLWSGGRRRSPASRVRQWAADPTRNDWRSRIARLIAHVYRPWHAVQKRRAHVLEEVPPGQETQEDIWLQFRPTIKTEVRAYSPTEAIHCDMLILAHPYWLEQFAWAWPGLSRGKVELIELDAVDHLQIITPELSRFWIDAVRQQLA